MPTGDALLLSGIAGTSAIHSAIAAYDRWPATPAQTTTESR